MQLTNLAVWAVDHVFGAGTAERFPSDLEKTAASLIAGNPALSEQEVTAKIEADADELIQNCIGVKNAFALYVIDTLLDHEIGGIVADAYAKVGAVGASASA